MSSSAPRPLRCGDTARLRGDPPIGTAPAIRRWLLIEHPGPWPVQALDVFTGELRSTLGHAAHDVGGRILLFRRPGRGGQDRTRTTRSWAVVGATGTTWSTWTEPADLAAAASTLRHPPQVADPAPLLLVCAHGVHDTCCAVRGRPTAAALVAAYPDAVWETTHVGGDRFAPNVVVLPDGIYYGYLDADVAVEVVERHFAGQLSARHLRGLTHYPPPVQAAIGEVHRRFGPYGLNDVEVRSIAPPVAGRVDVDLALPDGRVLRAVVITTPRPPARLTCRATQDTSALDYAVAELAVLFHATRSTAKGDTPSDTP